MIALLLGACRGPAVPGPAPAPPTGSDSGGGPTADTSGLQWPNHTGIEPFACDTGAAVAACPRLAWVAIVSSAVSPDVLGVAWGADGTAAALVAWSAGAWVTVGAQVLPADPTRDPAQALVSLLTFAPDGTPRAPVTVHLGDRVGPGFLAPAPGGDWYVGAVDRSGGTAPDGTATPPDATFVARVGADGAARWRHAVTPDGWRHRVAVGPGGDLRLSGVSGPPVVDGVAVPGAAGGGVWVLDFAPDGAVSWGWADSGGFFDRGLTVAADGGTRFVLGSAGGVGTHTLPGLPPVALPFDGTVVVALSPAGVPVGATLAPAGVASAAVAGGTLILDAGSGVGEGALVDDAGAVSTVADDPMDGWIQGFEARGGRVVTWLAGTSVALAPGTPDEVRVDTVEVDGALAITGEDLAPGCLLGVPATSASTNLAVGVDGAVLAGGGVAGDLLVLDDLSPCPYALRADGFTTAWGGGVPMTPLLLLACGEPRPAPSPGTSGTAEDSGTAPASPPEGCPPGPDPTCLDLPWPAPTPAGSSNRNCDAQTGFPCEFGESCVHAPGSAAGSGVCHARCEESACVPPEVCTWIDHSDYEWAICEPAPDASATRIGVAVPGFEAWTVAGTWPGRTHTEPERGEVLGSTLYAADRDGVLATCLSPDGAVGETRRFPAPYGDLVALRDDGEGPRLWWLAGRAVWSTRLSPAGEPTEWIWAGSSPEWGSAEVVGNRLVISANGLAWSSVRLPGGQLGPWTRTILPGPTLRVLPDRRDGRVWAGAPGELWWAPEDALPDATAAWRRASQPDQPYLAPFCDDLLAVWAWNGGVQLLAGPLEAEPTDAPWIPGPRIPEPGGPEVVWTVGARVWVSVGDTVWTTTRAP